MNNLPPRLQGSRMKEDPYTSLATAFQEDKQIGPETKKEGDSHAYSRHLQELHMEQFEFNTSTWGSRFGSTRD